jgi:hypothetical protein
MLSRKTIVLFVFLSLFSGGLSDLSAATYYFSSTEGEDSRASVLARNPSTPWRSLHKLNLIMSSLSPGDSVLFKRGEVFYGTINVTNGGNSSAPIVFGAYGSGQKPIITSLIRLNGWTSKGNGVFESNTSINHNGRINVVTLNGTPYAMGRFPNSNAAGRGYLMIDAIPSDNAIQGSGMGGSVDWSGGEIVIRKNPWVIDRHPITGASNSRIDYGGIQTKYKAQRNYGFFIQNHPATLDEFGEWYFNENTQKLSVFFGNQNPEQVQVEVSNVSNLIHVNWGKGHLVFSNLDLRGANERGVFIEEAPNVSILNCNISLMGEFAIAGVLSHDLEVNGCKITESLNNGIFIPNTTRNVKIRNNEIVNTFMFNGMGRNADLNGQAIYTSGNADNGVIENNRIINTGYMAINFGGNNTIVKNNFIDNYCVHKTDGGGIYSWEGPTNRSLSNRLIKGNIVLNGIGYKEGTPDVFTVAPPPVEGIYLDDNTSGVSIKNNTLANISGKGVFFHNARNVDFEENLVYNSSEAVFFGDDNLGDAISNVNVFNNTLFLTKPDQYFFRFFSSKGNGFESLGKISSNNYVNPFGNAYGIFIERINSTQNANQILDLATWGKDAGFNFIPHKIDYYSSWRSTGNNLFANGNFDQNLGSVFCVGCSMSRKTGNGFSGGFLHVSAKRRDSFGLAINSLKANKHYALTFKAKSNKNTGLEVRVGEDGPPWTELNRPMVIELGTEIQTHKLLFLNKFNIEKANIVLFATADGVEIEMDEVIFTEAEVDFYNPEELFFDHNFSNSSSKRLIAGTYMDAKANVFPGSVDIPAFGGVALFRVNKELQSQLVPPTLSITHPVAVNSVAVGEKVKFLIDASGNGANLERVELFVDDKLVIGFTGAPYEHELVFEQVGSFTIKARVVAKNGLEAFSEAIVLQVVAAADPLVINWISPSDKQVFVEGDTILMAVELGSLEDKVELVEFLSNDVVIGNVKSPPFQLAITDFTDGFYLLKAVARSALGLEVSTNTISIRVGENKIPEIPKLLSPVNLTEGIVGVIKFSWEITAHAEKYSIQVAEDASFSKLIIDRSELTLSSFDFVNPEAGKRFFWRVSASNAMGTSLFSEVWQVQTLQRPMPPILGSPANLAKGLEGIVVFQWKGVGEVDEFQLQVSEFRDFSQRRVSRNNLKEESFTVDNLELGKTYFWRVRAVNRAGNSLYSAIREFQTRPSLAIPGAPILLSPSRSGTVQVGEVKFDWNPVPFASRYHIQVSRFSDFSQLVVFENQDLTTNSAFFSQPDPETIYFWRVRAINNSGTGPFSPVWNFKTDKVAALNAPELVSPIDAVAVFSSTVGFKWQAVEDSEYYQLFVSRDSTFKQNLLFKTSTPEFELNGLAVGERYYWKVVANGKRPSSVSNVRNFIVRDGNETLFGNILIYPNPFNDEIFLKFSNPIEGTIQLSLLDTKGALVIAYSKDAPSGLLAVQIPHTLSPGLYLLKVSENSGFAQTFRLVKK